MSSRIPAVKPLFVPGEKVLCFEPDPTKAKVLYDSKVLEVDWTKDDKGKKVPEYLVHFNGWNHSWDRWAPEEFVLKDSEENRDLQDRLQRDAEEKIKKKKKKKKLDEIIEETRQKNLISEKKSKNEASSEDEDDTANENETSTEEEEPEPEDIPIHIPDVLKSKLEDDCYFINSKKQLVQLPIQPNIITIFENYLRYFSLNVHMSEKHRPLASTNVVHGLYANKTDGPQNVLPEHNNELVKEILEDLRVIFDFSLPLVLLYGCERAQYTKISTSTFLPVLPAKRREEEDEFSGDPEITFKSHGTPRNKQSQKRTASPPSLVPEYSLPSKMIKNEIEEVEVVTPTRRITRRQSTEQRSAEKNSPAVSHVAPTSICVMPSRVELRRRNETKSTPSQVAASPSVEKSISTRHSTRNNPQQTSPPQQTPQQQTPLQITAQISQQQVSQQPPCIGNGRKGNASVCSSSRSTPGICEVSNCSWNLRDCTDVLSWTLLPSDFSYEGPTPPCLIYGVQHLLRMFVKLPEILGRMQIPAKTLKPLVKHIEGIVKYLCLPDNLEELFIDTAYVDAEEVYGNFKKPVASH
ncbi:MSL complex subunit 3-like [Glandiceps talaboti]